MVKEIENNSKALYSCEECGFSYAEKYLADKCEAWCKKHNSCSMEITKYAVKG